MIAISLVCSLLFVVLLRFLIAFSNLRRVRRLENSMERTAISHVAKNACIVQPILGGDPSLTHRLRSNIRLYPDMPFIWLVDENDEIGMNAATEALKDTNAKVRILRAPVARSNHNPKVSKLAWGYDEYSEIIFVLDDDCILSSGSIEKMFDCLSFCDLVTGTPFYSDEGSRWSRLLAKFPNGQSILTYFSLLSSLFAKTVNGMFYATTKTSLNKVGGFNGFVQYLCDDFEIAKAFSRHQLKIFQSTAYVDLFTSVPSFRDYYKLMHRWAFFANRQVVELVSLKVFILLLIPFVLPLIGLVVGLTSDIWSLFGVFSVLWLKSELVLLLRRKFFGNVSRNSVFFEIITDIITPLFYIRAAFSRKIAWRSKVITSNREALHWSD